MVANRKDGNDTLLDHVARYRFTTLDVVHRLFYPNASIHAVRKAVQRLSFNGDPLLENVRLAPRIHVLQQHKRGKIGVTTAWTRFALLHFCCSQPTRRKRLTETEFYGLLKCDRLEGVDPNNQHYFLPLDASPRLGIALVDYRPTPHTPSAQTRSGGKDLARRICHCWRRLDDTPLLNELHSQKLTIVSAIVATSSKAEAVSKALEEEAQQYRHLQTGAFEITVVPQLLHFFS